ncbi:MAG TPA: MBL fold metallo-hydrolase [Pyrinomonadaceae bacterium]|nr:MBL fold metallo-hydrolase [Pyrinomonadaceae bacterium]
MRTKTPTLLLLLLFPALTAAAQTSDLFAVKVRKVKEGVYLAYRPEPLRPYVEGNVTVIVNERDVVLVDAGGSPSTARRVIAELKRLTPNPVSLIVYTHIHRDHRFGTQEYVKAFPGVEIVSHPAIRDIIAGSGQKFVADTIRRIESQKPEGEAEMRRLREEGRPGSDKVVAHLRRFYEQDIDAILGEYRGIVNVTPTLTFDRRMTLHRGARTVELLFLGRGDTPHDTVVYLPNDKLVCAGDMVVHPVPYGFSEQPSEWLDTLGRLSELDFDTLVPGHGEVQRGKDYVRSLMSLIRSVQTQVKAGAGAGLDLEGVRRRVDLSEFERQFAGDDPILRYFFREYFSDPNVERTYKELKARAGR